MITVEVWNSGLWMESFFNREPYQKLRRKDRKDWTGTANGTSVSARERGRAYTGVHAAVMAAVVRLTGRGAHSMVRLRPSPIPHAIAMKLREGSMGRWP